MPVNFTNSPSNGDTVTVSGVTYTFSSTDSRWDVTSSNTINTEGVQDIVGAMFSGNTETGINVAYEDSDGTIDLEVQSAPQLSTARNIGGVSFNGTTNINLPGVNEAGTQNTTGNASTATALATARTIGGVSFDGSANIDLPGVNSSGNQDTSGNAATATALATARNIGGVSFDGTANINLPGVNSAGNQDTTGNAATATALETARTLGGVSFDGSANIDLPGVNTGGNQNTTGSAATLTTARTIGGVSFNGSANIDLPGVNTVGNQNTTGSAATLTTARTIGGVSFDGSANIAPNIVTDTTPQLGGDLDVNGNDIVSTSNGVIDLNPHGSGQVVFVGNSTRGAGQFKLNCEQNSHGITIKGPPHSANASYTLTLPNNDGNAKQILQSDGSGVLSFVDQIKTVQTNLTMGAAASAGDVIVYEGASSAYKPVGTTTTSAAITGTESAAAAGSAISYLGTANDRYFGEMIAVPAYGGKIFIKTVESGTNYYRWVTLNANNTTSISGTGSMPSTYPVGEMFLAASNKLVLLGTVGSNTSYNVGTINTSTGAVTWQASNTQIWTGTTIFNNNNNIVYDTNDEKWVVVYEDGTNGVMRTLTYDSSNDTLSASSSVTLKSGGLVGSSIAYDTNRNAGLAIYGTGNGTSSQVFFKKWTSSNGTLTLGSETEITNTTYGDYTKNANGEEANIVFLPTRSLFIMVYSYTFDWGFGNRTWPIGINSAVIEANGTVTIANKATITSSNAIGGAPQTMVVDDSSNTVLIQDRTTYNTGRYHHIKQVQIAANGSISSQSSTQLDARSGGPTQYPGGVIFSDTVQKGFSYYRYYTLPMGGGASTTGSKVWNIQNEISQSNLLLNNIVGIADEAISSAASGPVNLIGGIDTNQSGLTVGSTYYVESDGDLSTSATSPNKKLGVAISATEILMEHTTTTSSSSSSSSSSSGIASVAADTTPQLGGALDVNGNDIVSTSNGDIELDPNGSGVVVFKGNSTKGAGQFKLNCEQNSHGIVIKGPPHSAAASYTLTLPDNDGDANQVLKTDGSGGLSWVDQSGGGGGSQNVFSTVAVSGQSNVVADSTTDTLTLVAGTGITLTTDASADSVTITNSVSAGATSINDLSDAVYNSNALSLFLGSGAGAAVTNSASANVAVGVNAGDSITSANYNVLLGYNAGNAITTGSKNIVIGGQAYNATSSNGSHNILIGYNAEATSNSTNNEMTIGTASGDGLINNVRIPGVDFTMNTTALHYGAEIRADGDVVAYYSSDERLKENIEIIPDAVSKVQQIRGVTFDWKDEYLESQGGEDDYFHRKHDSGVIAQEVEKVLPEVVAERKDGMKAVRYEKLVAVLIEAVKELKQEIEELKGDR